MNVARVATKKVKADRCVSMLKALADEHRWDIVRTLLAESLSVSQLGERLDMAQPSVSKHLNILRAAGIVVTERVVKEVRGVQVRDKLEVSLRGRPGSQPPQLNGLEIELQTPGPKTNASKASDLKTSTTK